MYIYTKYEALQQIWSLSSVKTASCLHISLYVIKQLIPFYFVLFSIYTNSLYLLAHVNSNQINFRQVVKQ